MFRWVRRRIGDTETSTLCLCPDRLTHSLGGPENLEPDRRSDTVHTHFLRTDLYVPTFSCKSFYFDSLVSHRLPEVPGAPTRRVQRPARTVVRGRVVIRCTMSVGRIHNHDRVGVPCLPLCLRISLIHRTDSNIVNFRCLDFKFGKTVVRTHSLGYDAPDNEGTLGKEEGCPEEN